jgi:hypothetical protein
MLCRQQARRQQRRLANRRYQQTPYRRDDHRDRQREYRRRRIQARVTDLSSLALSSNGRIPLRRSFPMLDPHGKESGAVQRDNGLLRCVICGRLGRFVEPFPRIFMR